MTLSLSIISIFIDARLLIRRNDTTIPAQRMTVLHISKIAGVFPFQSHTLIRVVMRLYKLPEAGCLMRK